jgi:hypothetical protein
MGPLDVPTSFLRTLRAFRIIKLFGKLEQVLAHSFSEDMPEDMPESNKEPPVTFCL